MTKKHVTNGDSIAPITPAPLTGRRRRRIALATALAVLHCVAGARALAADPIAGLEVPVSIQAREQPVEKFLRELFGQIGVPVQVDADVRGAVNGDFDKSAGQVLEDVRKAFQLTYYYDGAVLYVYPASDLSRDVMYMSGGMAGQVTSNAASLNLTDADNRLETADVGLIATGTRRFLEQVSELADAVRNRTVSSASPPEAFRVFKLRYGWAGDVSIVTGGQKVVVPGVASLLASLVGARGIGAPAEAQASGVEREPLPSTRPKLKGEGLQADGAPERPTLIASAAPTGLAAVTTLPADGLGRPTIVADPLNNAVVIRDRADRMASYERLIDTLDVEPLMVELEATIIDLNTERLRELGIDWRLRYGETGSLLDGARLTPIGEGGLVSLVFGDRARFISRIRALEAQGAARIVSKPHVITLANVEAVLDSTSTFFVRVEGDREVDLFDVSVGTTLRVTPHVSEGRGGSQIKLLVSIQDGTASDRRVDDIPVIERSTINTQALVEEGQSLLIGGLIRESDQNSVSKVPLLGDIPGLGALFRSNEKVARRTERLFLITPRLTARMGGGEGLRLDAPIRQGDEIDIVRSAPLRLEPVRAALAERDESFPVLAPLPEGSTRVDLDRIDTSVTTLRPNAPVKLERVAPGASSPSIEGPQLLVPSQGSMLDAGRRDADREAADRGAEPVGDGWGAVPGSEQGDR